MGEHVALRVPFARGCEDRYVAVLGPLHEKVRRGSRAGCEHGGMLQSEQVSAKVRYTRGIREEGGVSRHKRPQSAQYEELYDLSVQ